MMNNNNSFNSPFGRGNRNGGHFFSAIKQFLSSGSALSIMININIVVFLLSFFASVVGWLFTLSSAETHQVIVDIFGVPAAIPSLLQQPWSIVTYMFLHVDFFHILFNMLWLYWFGQLFLRYFSTKHFISTYLWGGLIGALLFIFSFNVFPVFEDMLPYSHAIGASAAVMAITAAVASAAPNYRINLLFIGPVKLWVFAVVYLGIDFLMIPNGNAGGHISHLGGAMWGLLFAYLYRKNIDFMTFDFSKITQLFSKKPTFKTKVNHKRPHQPKADETFNMSKKENQKKVDIILDKISKNGYNALTKSEKEFLFKQKR